MSLTSWGGELKPVVVWSLVACFDCRCRTLTNLKGEKWIPSCYARHIYAQSLLPLFLTHFMESIQISGGLSQLNKSS